MTPTINILAFKDLLETYGTDLSRWPAKDQVAAHTILEQSEEAQDLFASMVKVDKLFKQNDTPLPPDLLARILEKAQKS